MARSLATRSSATALANTERAVLRWLVCASLALAMFVAAEAQPVPESPAALMPEDPPEAHVAQRGAVSLQQATAMATGRYQGRVVRAETVSRGDRVVHEIRILGEDGRVRTVRIDAQTGQFL